MTIRFYNKNPKYKNKPRLHDWPFTYILVGAAEINIKSKSKAIDECLKIIQQNNYQACSFIHNKTEIIVSKNES